MYMIYLHMCILSIFIIKGGAIAGGVVGGSAGLAIGALATYAIVVLIAVLCCSSCEGRSEMRCNIIPASCALHSICLPHTQVIAMSSSVSTVVEVCLHT